jgi:hypothetical protein
MITAFVLGNGKSRLFINLENLKKHGKIYGCNALYREFTPDYLIAVDPKMIIEICNTGYQLQNQVWTNPNSRYTNFKNLNFFKPSRGWSSGPTALLKACMDGNSRIFILGFDYYGIGNNFNNVYANTLNYKRSTDTATYYGNWLRQTETVIKQYTHIHFYRVIDDRVKQISEWNMLNNYDDIDYNRFLEISGCKIP